MVKTAKVSSKNVIITTGEDISTSLSIQLESEVDRPLHFTVLNDFYFVKTGSATFKVGQEEILATPFSIIFVPALMPYSFKTYDSAEVWRFSVSERYMADFYECYPNKSLPFFMDDKAVNTRIYNYVNAEFSTTKLTELEKIAIVAYVLGKFSAHYHVEDKVMPGDSQIAEVIKYIHKNYTQDITLDLLAKEFCVSKMVLSRKLSKYIGIDLRKFISDIRISAYLKMRNDKRYAGLSSVELAYKCGFKSYETFYRAFKRRNAE